MKNGLAYCSAKTAATMAMMVRLRLRTPTGAETVVVVSSSSALRGSRSVVSTPIMAPFASCERLSGLGLELLLDHNGSLRTLCRCHDHELYVERGVPHYEYSRHAGLAVAIGLDGALPRELAPELRRERLLLVLPGGEEQRAARDGVSVLQVHRGEPAVRVLEAGDPPVVHRDALGEQLLPDRRWKPR